MEELIRLSEEIQNDPAVIGLAGKTVEELYIILNNLDGNTPRTYFKLLPAKTFKHWARKSGIFQEIKALAEKSVLSPGGTDFSGVTAEEQATAEFALNMWSGSDDFDANDADDTTLLTTLRDAGAITNPQLTTLRDLAEVTDGSRVAELGIVEDGDRVFRGHINMAMSLIPDA